MPASPSRSRPIYQETGRAGRDGEPAEAWLFWGAEDFATARRRIETEVEDGAPAGRARAAQCARRAGRDRRLPPRDPAAPFRRGSARALRQLRQLPRAAAGDRRHHDRAETAVGRLPHRDALRSRPSDRRAGRARDRQGAELRPSPAQRVRHRRRGGAGAGQAGGAGAARARRAARRRFWRPLLRPRRPADPQGRGEARDRAAAEADAQAPRAPRRAPNIATIPCSRRCASGAARSRPRPACRPTSSSTTAPCARWPS